WCQIDKLLFEGGGEDDVMQRRRMAQAERGHKAPPPDRPAATFAQCRQQFVEDRGGLHPGPGRVESPFQERKHPRIERADDDGGRPMALEGHIETTEETVHRSRSSEALC